MIPKDRYFAQGEDLDFTGKLLDFAGDPIDLTALPAYSLYVAIHDSYGRVVKKFATDTGGPIPGWETIDVTGGANGEFRIFLYSTETAVLEEGRYYIEVRFKDVQALYNPDDGALDTGKVRVYLISILKSVIAPLL